MYVQSDLALHCPQNKSTVANGRIRVNLEPLGLKEIADTHSYDNNPLPKLPFLTPILTFDLVTLTLDFSGQMFEMAYLLVVENNCARFNPRI